MAGASVFIGRGSRAVMLRRKGLQTWNVDRTVSEHLGIQQRLNVVDRRWIGQELCPIGKRMLAGFNVSVQVTLWSEHSHTSGIENAKDLTDHHAAR